MNMDIDWGFGHFSFTGKMSTNQSSYNREELHILKDILPSNAAFNIHFFSPEMSKHTG